MQKQYSKFTKKILGTKKIRTKNLALIKNNSLHQNSLIFSFYFYAFYHNFCKEHTKLFERALDSKNKEIFVPKFIKILDFDYWEEENIGI